MYSLWVNIDTLLLVEDQKLDDAHEVGDVVQHLAVVLLVVIAPVGVGVDYLGDEVVLALAAHPDQVQQREHGREAVDLVGLVVALAEVLDPVHELRVVVLRHVRELELGLAGVGEWVLGGHEQPQGVHVAAHLLHRVQAEFHRARGDETARDVRRACHETSDQVRGVDLFMHTVYRWVPVVYKFHVQDFEV